MERLKSTVYELQEPWKVVEVEKEREMKEGWVAIQPSHGSICHADLRYYTGNRRKEALEAKLPMALIHEGIGTVIASNDKQFKKGDRVVVVPNIPGRIMDPDGSSKTSDQYSETGAFMGSGYDGMAQSCVVHPAECLLKIPESISDELAVLAELNSVSVSALRNVEEVLQKKDIRVAVFGDGPVGYLTSAYMRYRFNLDFNQLTVFGAAEDKLSMIDFAQTENVLTYDFDSNHKQFDVVIECTGGNFSKQAINQAIDVLDYLGHLVLMGVTEDLVPMNTRDILEKGLTLHGSSRSVTEDFQKYLETLEASEGYVKAMEKILPEENNMVKNAEDFMKVMSYHAENHGWKKVIMEFVWRD